MNPEQSHALKNFETYCLVLIEMHKLKYQDLGMMSPVRIDASIDALRKKINGAIEKECDLTYKTEKKILATDLIGAYENWLKKQ